MYYGGYGLYFDWTYILVILAFVLSMIVQTAMQSTFRKYSRVRSSYGMTGAQVAQRILESEGIYGVQVRPVRGNLTDHYDPRSKTVNLSESIYGSTSVAALGVAAHECGHAIQDARDYAPLRIRSALVPAANFGSQFSWILFFIGLVLQSGILTEIGILLFCFALLFQLVTLPVEFNASHRAMQKLKTLGMEEGRELSDTRKVLTAAAMTYVAAVCASLLYLLRMILLSGGNRRRD
ncbi:MAG: zinc metallopeptidase [Bilifractor sp.]|nr:zinc metallopeptidase [Lachnospiraceae bacterium]MDY2837571.1 zinc metallopeptidase [Bilifractor sp.]